MAKQLLFSDDARRKMLEGVDNLAHAVGHHARARPAATSSSSKSFGGPTVTKDGVTVSKEIELPDPFENMGAKLVNVVAQKTTDVAGDGTTTATILALRDLPAKACATSPPAPTRRPSSRGIDKAVEAAVERAARQALQAGLQEGRDRPGRRHLAPTTTRRSAS